MIICPWNDLKRYAPVINGLEEAMEAVNNLPSMEPATYPLSNGNKILVQLVNTKNWADSQLEAHREYLDIQYIIKGKEIVGWAPLNTLTPAGPFNTEKDKGMYIGKNTPVCIDEGYCYVVFPEDAHAPSVHMDEAGQVSKVVIKLKV